MTGYQAHQFTCQNSVNRLFFNVQPFRNSAHPRFVTMIKDQDAGMESLASFKAVSTCARACSHDNGVCRSSAGIIAHALQKVSIRDSSGCKEDLLARAEIVCVKDLQQTK